MTIYIYIYLKGNLTYAVALCGGSDRKTTEREMGSGDNFLFVDLGDGFMGLFSL